MFLVYAMLDPNLFARNQPAAAPPPVSEPAAVAHARHLDMLREMAELGMRAARAATDRIVAAPEPSDAKVADPSLTLARATHAVRQAIALEQRVRAGVTPVRPLRRLGPDDKRRAPLREALHDAAKKAEPDRAARAKLCRFIDERLDAELNDDPEGKIAINKLLEAIANQLGLVLDVAQLSDEVLGMKPRTYAPDRPLPQDDDFNATPWPPQPAPQPSAATERATSPPRRRP